jgi:hypothetical protein
MKNVNFGVHQPNIQFGDYLNCMDIIKIGGYK